MPILRAAVVPNLTILAPGVCQANIVAYSQTVQAYEELAASLQEQNVETVVIISSRGLAAETGITINMDPKFNINFEEFGDLSTKLEVNNDYKLIKEIKDKLSDSPISMVSFDHLDYGSAVPLVYFLAKNPKLKLVTIYTSLQGLYSQGELGTELAEIIHAYTGRVALIASVNLSSRLASSPLGYLPKAKGHDKKIINSLESDDYRFLYNFEVEEIKEYYEQGLAPLAMFAGAISPFKKSVKELSYEHPQGLGMLVLDVDF